MGAPKGHAPYPGCETGGRPRIHTDAFIENEADELEIWMQNKDNVFIESFVFDRDLQEDNLADWSKVNDKFARTFKRFKVRQKLKLKHGGLTKKYQYNMCQLLLGHDHGIIPKSEQKMTGDPMVAIIDTVQGKSRDLINE